jgi:hypothetical protein
MSNIEAVKNTIAVALAGPLPDGRFQQVLPLEYFYKDEEDWKNYMIKKYGPDVTFRRTELTVEALKQRNITWTCYYCGKGTGINHMPCVKQSGNFAVFANKRIWSDPTVQELYKNKI